MILWRHFLPNYQQNISAVIKSSQLDWENQQSLAYFHNKRASIVYRILINHKSSYATFGNPCAFYELIMQEFLKWLSYKVKFTQVSTHFPSLRIFVYKKVGNRIK